MATARVPGPTGLGGDGAASGFSPGLLKNGAAPGPLGRLYSKPKVPGSGSQSPPPTSLATSKALVIIGAGQPPGDQKQFDEAAQKAFEGYVKGHEVVTRHVG